MVGIHEGASFPETKQIGRDYNDEMEGRKVAGFHPRNVSSRANQESETDATSATTERFSRKGTYDIVAEIEGKTWFQPRSSTKMNIFSERKRKETSLGAWASDVTRSCTRQVYISNVTKLRIMYKEMLNLSFC